MIESIAIRNFQSIEKAEFKLGILTVILGQNDLGKSAVLRAIQAAVEAQSGVDFVTHGHTQCAVALKNEHGKLLWQKGTSVNKYILDDGTGAPAVFERVGKQVPPEVQVFLSMHPVEYDKQLTLNINFAAQDEPPFLIPMPGGVSPSSVAKVLGDLTQLNLLFKAVHATESRRKAAESTLKVRQLDLEQVEQQIFQLPDVAAEQQAVTSLAGLLEKVKEGEKRLNHLRHHLQTLDALRVQHEEIVAEERSIPKVVSLAHLEELVQRVHTLKGYAKVLQDMADEGERISADSQIAEAELQDRKKELEDLLETVEVCPTCLRPMEEAHVHA